MTSGNNTRNGNVPLTTFIVFSAGRWPTKVSNRVITARMMLRNKKKFRPASAGSLSVGFSRVPRNNINGNEKIQNANGQHGQGNSYDHSLNARRIDDDNHRIPAQCKKAGMFFVGTLCIWAFNRKLRSLVSSTTLRCRRIGSSAKGK